VIALGAQCRFRIAAFSVTPVWLELSERPTELVRLYVQFKGQNGQMHKGKVVSWDGPNCGYTVRFLGKRQLLRGISAVNMEFLPNQDEVTSRMVLSEDIPIAQLVGGHGKRKFVHGAVLSMGDGGAGGSSGQKRPVLEAKTEGGQHTCEWCGRSSNRVKDMGTGSLCGVCQLKHAEDTYLRIGSAAVCQEVNRRQQMKPSGASDPSPEVRRSKRECPASIVLGVHPFWQGNSLLYKFRVQHMGKPHEYGKYADENVAALARDYATRRIVSLTGGRCCSFNTEQFFLEDDAEKGSIDRWLEGFLSEIRQKPLHGVRPVKKTGGIEDYRHVLSVGGALVDFGTYSDKEFAGLVSDYISRDLLSVEAVNYPEKELLGHAELKSKLCQTFSEVVRSGIADTFVDKERSAATYEFWEAVKDGPVYACCSCHQTWFRKSVKPVTESLVGKAARGACAAAMTDISQWVCGTCNKYLWKGKVPPVCHLNYDPFKSLPEELQDLSGVENNLIALRLPFMKIRALDPSARGGPKKYGQLCLSGMVINVPTDLGRIQMELPRRFSADNTVLVNIKRRLRYKHCYETKNVRPYKILKALQFLTSHDTLWREAGVRMCPDFEESLGSAFNPF
jgi:hypothetical protein